MSGQKYLYLAAFRDEWDGPILKIGIASDPTRRIASLRQIARARRYNPAGVLLASSDEARHSLVTEGAIHKRLARLPEHIEGEWYKDTERLRVLADALMVSPWPRAMYVCEATVRRFLADDAVAELDNFDLQQGRAAADESVSP